jgi:hypothetical protein
MAEISMMKALRAGIATMKANHARALIEKKLNSGKKLTKAELAAFILNSAAASSQREATKRWH